MDGPRRTSSRSRTERGNSPLAVLSPKTRLRMLLVAVPQTDAMSVQSTAAVTYECKFKFLPSFNRVFTFPDIGDVERMLFKCSFRGITDLIDTCALSEGSIECERADIVKSLIKELNKCADCQSMQRALFGRYFLASQVTDKDNTCLETEITFIHREIKFQATFAWELRHCPSRVPQQ